MTSIAQPTTPDPVAPTIKQYLLETVLYDRPGLELTNHFPLLEAGLLDSLQIFNLVTFLQTRFGVTIPPTELLPENFASIQALAALVQRQRAVSV
jgi:acyl carrier protein